MNRLLTLLGVALTAIALGATLDAATVTWDGGGDGTTWTDANNWDTNAVPTATDEAVFDGTVAPTTVTGVTNTVQRIEVDSGANPALSIAFELAGNTTLTGLTGNALLVAAGDTVSFSSTSATVQTLQIEDDADVNGTLSTDATVNVSTATGTPTIALGDNSTFSLGGALEINAASTLIADNTSGATGISVADLRIDGSSIELDTAGGNPEMTLGAVTFLGTSPYFGGYNLLSFADSWTVTVNGNIDLGSATDAQMEADFVEFVIPSTSMITVSGGTAAFWWWGVLNVPSGGSLSIAAGLWNGTGPGGNFFLPYRVDIAGSFDAGGNSLWLYGEVDGTDGPGLTVGSTGSFTQTGATLLSGNSNSDINLLTGNFAFDGDVTLFFGDWRVALGSDVTFNGNVDADATGEGYIGADDDGSTSTTMADVRFNGNFSLSANHQLNVGEGRHYFNGDIDLSAADDRVVGPSGANTEPEVHFTGSAQALDFSAGGSYMIATSVASTTSITHSGLCIVAGDLDLSGSTQTDVWTSTTGSDMQIGDGNFGFEGELKVGNANVNFNAVTLLQVSNGNVDEHVEYTFSRDTGMTGVINLAWYLTIEGDTNDDSGTGTSTIEEENNAAILTISGADVYLDETVIDGSTAGPIAVHVLDGESDSVIPATPPPPPPADWQGNGAQLHLENGAILRAPNLKVGVASMTAGAGLPAPPITEHMGSKFYSKDSTIDFDLSGVGNGLEAGHYAVAELVNTTVQGQGSFKLVTVPETFQTTLLNCNIDRGTSVGGTPNVTVLVGGLNLTVVGNTISGLSGAGFWIRPNAVVRGFNENTFLSNTLQGGGVDTHITLQGLGAGSAQYWDNNHFDNSVNTGSGGLFVDVMSGSNPVQFRVPAGTPNGFGVTGFAVTAAQAETYDNDAAVVGTDVTWNDAANELTVLDEGGALPAGLITNSSILHQTSLLFGLNALSGNHTVDEVTVTFDVSATTLAESDIQSATLFEDANSNGVYDTGEEFAAGTLNQALTGSDVTFDLLGAGVSQTVNSGSTVHWGVSVRFATSGNGLDGTLRTVIGPGGVVLSNPASGIVSGLPVFSDLTVTGPAAALRMVTQPGGAAATTALTPQPAVEVIDGNGNRVLGDSTTVVNASIGTDPVGGSVLGGATGATVVDGLATFSNLSINQAGTGFTLDFAATGLTGTTSTTFNITAAPSGGGGGGGDDDEGCSTNDGTSWMLLAVFAALAALAVTRRLATDKR